MKNGFCAKKCPQYGIAFPLVGTWGGEGVGGFRSRNRRAPGAVSATKFGLLGSSYPQHSSSGKPLRGGNDLREGEDGGGGGGKRLTGGEVVNVEMQSDSLEGGRRRNEDEAR